MSLQCPHDDGFRLGFEYESAAPTYISNVYRYDTLIHCSDMITVFVKGTYQS